MPDRKRDIKQLFTHLGLDPQQYHEMHGSSDDIPEDTSKRERNWSLLRSSLDRKSTRQRPAPTERKTPTTEVPNAPQPTVRAHSAPEYSSIKSGEIPQSDLNASFEAVKESSASTPQHTEGQRPGNISHGLINELRLTSKGTSNRIAEATRAPRDEATPDRSRPRTEPSMLPRAKESCEPEVKFEPPQVAPPTPPLPPAGKQEPSRWMEMPQPEATMRDKGSEPKGAQPKSSIQGAFDRLKNPPTSPKTPENVKLKLKYDDRHKMGPYKDAEQSLDQLFKRLSRR